MRASAIVMANVLAKDSLNVAFVERDQEVEALPADRSDQALAIGVGLRSAERSPQNPYTETVQLLVEPRRKDPVAIMNQKPVRVIEHEELTELLDGPFRSRMPGNVEMQDPPRAGLHCAEHVTNPKRR